MNWRRFFLALAVTTVITLIADVLLNAVIFRSVYRRSAALLQVVNNYVLGLTFGALYPSGAVDARATQS